ncbi:hypothetical protein ETC03_10730 [Geobacillus sp. MMMUD3]|nr:hypothetical protein [Geobacillus sp. MMMUD3]
MISGLLPKSPASKGADGEEGTSPLFGVAKKGDDGRKIEISLLCACVSLHRCQRLCLLMGRFVLFLETAVSSRKCRKEGAMENAERIGTNMSSHF